jgi:ketosteroid isomerase-like protein
MPDQINTRRRRLLGTTVTGISLMDLGLSGPAQAQSNGTTASTKAATRAASFDNIREVNIGTEMTNTTALGTITSLIEARRSKNFDAAWACYEGTATVVLQPGQIGSGEAAIKAFIKEVSELALSFEGHQIIENGDVALHLSSYTLDSGTNGQTVGRTADVLRRKPDGSWRIVIDNAFAGADQLPP